MGKGWVAILVLAVLCTGFGVTDAGFVLDAQRVVAANRLIDDGSLTEIMNSRWWYDEAEVDATLYRPVPTLWFALIGRMGSGREDPRPFHLGSLLLHVLCAVARYCLLVTLLNSWSHRHGFAFLGALLPALHAVSMESVVCIVGTAEILASLLMTLSWWAFVSGLRGKGPRDGTLLLFTAAFAWFLALLSKETSVLFGVVLLLQWWLARDKIATSLPKGSLLLAAVLFVAAAAGWWFLRSNALGTSSIDFSGGPYGEFSAVERIYSALAVIATQYFPSLFLPFGLMPNITHQDVPPPDTFLQSSVLLGALLVLAALAGCALAFIKKRKTAFLLLAFSVLSFAPVSNLLVGIGTVGGFRLLYTPLFGLFAALVVLLGSPQTSASVRKFGLSALVLVGLVAAIASFPLIAAWQNSRTLGRYARQLNPMSVWALQNDIAARFTSGAGRVDFKEFTEAFAPLDEAEPKLATLPGKDRIDRDSRVILHRLYMQRAGAEGTYATTLRDAPAAFERSQQGIRAAVKAEEYGWGNPDLVFDARLTTFRLRLVALSHALRAQDEEEAKTTRREASDDAAILEGLMDGKISDRNRLAFLFEAARFAQMEKKSDLVDQYVERGLAIDKTDRQLTVMQATRLFEKKEIAAAYRVMTPVVESGKAGIEEFYLTAELCRHLGKNTERMTLLRRAMSCEARNDNEFQLRMRIGQILGG